MAITEAEYQKELAIYPEKVKASEDRYNKEMAEWEKKSLTGKVLENNF